MSQQDLINKIITEVKDEKLRDDLLRQIASGSPQPGATGSGDSALMSEAELVEYGFNPAGIQDFIRFQGKVLFPAAYIIGSLVAIYEGWKAVDSLFGPAGFFFPRFFFFPHAFFCAVGIYLVISARKIKRAVTPVENDGKNGLPTDCAGR